MFERFTDRARKVMALANEEAQRFDHDRVSTEHILLGLVNEGTGVGAHALMKMGINLNTLRGEVEKLMKRGPEGVQMGRLPHTPQAKRVIAYGLEEARGLNHDYVGTEHVLLGLLRESEGVATQVLTNLGISLNDARAAVLDVLGAGPEQGAAGRPPGPEPAPDKLTADGQPIEEFYQDDAVGELLQKVLTELRARKDGAMQRAAYETAAAYHELAQVARRMLNQLGSILSRERPAGDGGAK